MATQTNLNVVQSQNGSTTDIPLPKWNDFASVLTYITSFVAIGVGVIAALKPGFTEPAAVQAAIPAVALVVATGAQIFNAISHRSAQNAAAVASIAQNNAAVAPAPTGGPLQITTASPLTDATQNQAYSQALATTGGTPPITWASDGNKGSLVLNSSTGDLTGAPQDMVEGDLQFTVIATDSSAPPRSVQKVLQLHTAS